MPSAMAGAEQQQPALVAAATSSSTYSALWSTVTNLGRDLASCITLNNSTWLAQALGQAPSERVLCYVTNDPTQSISRPALAVTAVAALAVPAAFFASCALFRKLQTLRVVERGEARAIYDELGSTPNGANDAESGYGGPTARTVSALGKFSTALSVVEFGCGRGKLAGSLLRNVLPDEARYLMVDQSETMARNARENTSGFGPWRVSVLHIPSGAPMEVLVSKPELAGAVDRFVSCYCLDLLSDDDVAEVMRLAHEVLRAGEGRLVLAGITYGSWRMPITIWWALRWELMRLWCPPFRSQIGAPCAY